MDTGLEGDFRSHVHAIEEAVEAENQDQLTIDMLNIRRREKDYLLRGEQSYVDNVHDLVIQFKGHVADSDLPAAEKLRLNTLIDEYETSFDALIQVDQDIEASIATYRDAIHQLEPLLLQIETQAIENQAASQIAMQNIANTATMIIVAVSIIVVFLAVLFAILLSRNISRAVRQIAVAAQGIAEGDLDQNVEVEGRDELHEMAEAFQRMIAYMQQMADIATSLADGDLAVNVVPNSERDVLGNAFSRMVIN